MFVCCDCCMLSGRGLCNGLITRPEESYRPWRVVVCDQETSNTRRLSPLPGCENTTTMGCNARKRNNKQALVLLPSWWTPISKNISAVDTHCLCIRCFGQSGYVKPNVSVRWYVYLHICTYIIYWRI
jgi:hypothetical protein